MNFSRRRGRVRLLSTEVISDIFALFGKSVVNWFVKVCLKCSTVCFSSVFFYSSSDITPVKLKIVFCRKSHSTVFRDSYTCYDLSFNIGELPAVFEKKCCHPGFLGRVFIVGMTRMFGGVFRC